jgi:hypothetical protein
MLDGIRSTVELETESREIGGMNDVGFIDL